MASKSVPTRHPSTNNKLQVPIGGPGTLMPFWFESFLSWIFAILCLTVALYHWIIQKFASSLQQPLFKNPNQTSSTSHTYVPLTTYCHREVTEVSLKERCIHFQQLCLLEQHRMTNIEHKSLGDVSDLQFIQTIRSNLILRRLATLIIIHNSMLSLKPSTNDSNLTSNENDDPVVSKLTKRLLDVWSHLVPLPSTATVMEDDNKKYPYEISIIMPAFNEDGKQLQQKLQIACDMAVEPQKIEVLLVDAGRCTNLNSIAFDRNNNTTCTNGENSNNTTNGKDSSNNNTTTTTTTQTKKFANIQCIPNGIGGRGPCLNLGAKYAQGRIYTFLHADTKLSKGWDVAIRKVFTTTAESSFSSSSSSPLSQTTTRIGKRKVANSCAFSFAIDTPSSSKQEEIMPPGIRAIETTANLRTHWFSLPYGDQCISLPSYVFDYIGGFPDQCLMEDYELVKLLRMRCMQQDQKEYVAILDEKAYCSPRRWQTYGVLLVTYMNSHCVTLYSRGDYTADDIFKLYYRCGEAPPRCHPKYSPWEIELHELLRRRKDGS